MLNYYPGKNKKAKNHIELQPLLILEQPLKWNNSKVTLSRMKKDLETSFSLIPVFNINPLVKR